MTQLEQQDENDHLINRPELPAKPHVRWRAISNGQPHFPELHKNCVYTLWLMEGRQIVIHEGPSHGREFDPDTDSRVLAILSD